MAQLLLPYPPQAVSVDPEHELNLEMKTSELRMLNFQIRAKKLELEGTERQTRLALLRLEVVDADRAFAEIALEIHQRMVQEAKYELGEIKRERMEEDRMLLETRAEAREIVADSERLRREIDEVEVELAMFRGEAVLAEERERGCGEGETDDSTDDTTDAAVELPLPATTIGNYTTPSDHEYSDPESDADSDDEGEWDAVSSTEAESDEDFDEAADEESDEDPDDESNASSWRSEDASMNSKDEYLATHEEPTQEQKPSDGNHSYSENVAIIPGSGLPGAWSLDDEVVTHPLLEILRIELVALCLPWILVILSGVLVVVGHRLFVTMVEAPADDLKRWSKAVHTTQNRGDEEGAGENEWEDLGIDEENEKDEEVDDDDLVIV